MKILDQPALFLSAMGVVIDLCLLCLREVWGRHALLIGGHAWHSCLKLLRLVPRQASSSSKVPESWSSCSSPKAASAYWVHAQVEAQEVSG